MGTFLTTGALREDIVEVVSSVTPLILTPKSPTILNILGSVPQTIKLPDATKLVTGVHYIIINNSTEYITITDFVSGSITTLEPTMSLNIYLLQNTTTAGNWSILGAGGLAQIKVTLLHSQAIEVVVPEFTFDYTTCQAKILDYAIKEGTTNHVRTGQIMISVNMSESTVALHDYFSETANIGVDWNGAINGTEVEISYTTAEEDSHTNKQMSASIKNILF
jgi:hypothetical protein